MGERSAGTPRPDPADSAGPGDGVDGSRETIRTAEQAGAWLEGLINFEREPDFRYERMGLGAIRALMAALGDPQRGLSIVHIAGSKGKGSTALLLEHLLQALDESVGTFTSPHLESWTERFRVRGTPIPGPALARAVESIRRPVELQRRGEPALRPTFFDATTAAALVLFADQGVDRTILEVGLGGRLDSTNVVTAELTCITTIELEHTDKLGDTLALIAGEKAGILERGVPAVVGRLPEEAMAVVRDRVRELGVDAWYAGQDFAVEVDESKTGRHGRRLRYRDRTGSRIEASLPLLGRHHADNAGLALACLARLPGRGPEDVARAAPSLATVSLPGRVEILGRDPWLVVDAAHTAASARALAEALSDLPCERRHLVLSISAGKDLDSILAALLPGLAELTLTRADPHRSLEPAEVAAAVRAVGTDAELHVVPNPHLAVRAARESASPGDLVCATGSVYLAGIARSAWRDPVGADAESPRRDGPAPTGPGA